MCSCAGCLQHEERAARLLDAIKIETRWQLLARGGSTVDHDGTHVGPMRKKLLAEWPRLRAGRLSPSELADYYAFAASRADRLALLISIRNAREYARKVAK